MIGLTRAQYVAYWRGHRGITAEAVIKYKKMSGGAMVSRRRRGVADKGDDSYRGLILPDTGCDSLGLSISRLGRASTRRDENVSLKT